MHDRELQNALDRNDVLAVQAIANNKSDPEVTSEFDPIHAAPSSASAPSRYRWSLQSLLLILTVAAAWTAYWRTVTENDRLRNRIRSIQDVAREIAIGDLGQFAAVRRPAVWMDDNQWNVYLPPSFRHRLLLATEKIGTDGIPKSDLPVEIPHGQHHIQLTLLEEPMEWRIQVEVDGRVAMDQTQPKDWYPATGHSQVGVSKNETMPPDQPLLLMRRRFHDRSKPVVQQTDESNGIMLWIEAEPPTAVAKAPM